MQKSKNIFSGWRKNWFLTSVFKFWVPKNFAIFMIFQLHTKGILIHVHTNFYDPMLCIGRAFKQQSQKLQFFALTFDFQNGIEPP